MSRKKRLAWRDDFTGPAGAPPNPRFWTPQVGGWGWGNEELQRYTPDPDNASLDGSGHLTITAREDTVAPTAPDQFCWYGPCRYTSARLITADKVTPRYGRIEARIKVPAGAGLWPAFWMLGEDFFTVGHPQSGEVDIMEIVGKEPATAWASVHGPGYTGLSNRFDLPPGSTFADDFHTFAVDWSPDGLVFSVDGQAYHSVPPADAGANEWVFDQPFFLVLNLAVGGRWPGEPTPQTQFPASMLVDYVAVYR